MLAAWRNEEMDSMDMEEIRNNLIILREAVTAIPINFPGFYYHKALKVCFPKRWYLLESLLVCTNMFDDRAGRIGVSCKFEFFFPFALEVK